ncbi:hypothetical protein SDC9_90497 [bioreactor metagenome]|uniref:Uncharacterized protein n=1 Tax=bioreactor metagenome TaxID=1076179 RepID=A0A644ZS86_9ZZZZ
MNALRRFFGLNERTFDALDLLLLGGDGNEVSRLVPSALLFYNPFNPLDFAKRILVLSHGELAFVHFLFHGLRVVAAVDVQAAVFHFKDLVADMIEKIAVMGNDDIRAAEHRKVRFQPLKRSDVEMVGRFVQQK